MIDIEFIDQEKVLSAWRALFAHYAKQEHPGLNDDQIFNEREELFATLLYEISQVLKYKFDRTYVRDNIYRPKLHGDLDSIELDTRKRINNLLRSDALPVRFLKEKDESFTASIVSKSESDEAKATSLES